MIIREFNKLEEIQKYYDKETNTYIFKEDGKDIDLVIFNFDLRINAHIKAYDIKAYNIVVCNINALNIEAFDIIASNIQCEDINAFNITAFNINAGDIDANEIKARDISYWGVCFAYKNIICTSIKGRKENHKHFVLDGSIKVLKNGELCEKDLEKLKQENQELKEKVNHFEKVIEVMQNSSKLDCTHMFDNCKKLTPLTEKKEHKMTSKEAVLELICEAKSVNRDEGRVSFLRKIIEKDLEIVECFRKIPKQDLRDFIDWQLRYEKMIKNWLDERPFLYVDKEDPTKHLIKIKEWLEK